jgi:hypothetical protein
VGIDVACHDKLVDRISDLAKNAKNAYIARWVEQKVVCQRIPECVLVLGFGFRDGVGV